MEKDCISSLFTSVTLFVLLSGGPSNQDGSPNNSLHRPSSLSSNGLLDGLFLSPVLMDMVYMFMYDKVMICSLCGRRTNKNLITHVICIKILHQMERPTLQFLDDLHRGWAIMYYQSLVEEMGHVVAIEVNGKIYYRKSI